MIAVLGCGRGGPQEGNPQTLIQQGWDEFRLNETIRAEEFFKKAAALAEKGSPSHLMALYGWGASLSYRTPDPLEEEGAKKYEEVISLAPQSDMAAWCLLGLARSIHAVPVGRDPDFDKVRAAYDRLTASFPDHVASEEAFLYKQSTYVSPLKEEGAKSALAAVLDFLERKPDSKWQSAGWGLAAECYAILDNPEKRLDAEIKALDKAELDPNNPRSDFSGAYWKIASLAEFRAGDFSVARKFYKKLMDEYPTDQKRFASEKALERMDATEAALKLGKKP